MMNRLRSTVIRPLASALAQTSRASRVVAQTESVKRIAMCSVTTHNLTHRFVSERGFHSTRHTNGEIGFKLADIGEGIAEVEVLQWFVKPGDTIRQFDKVCEVQSDKATVEITSRYDGVVVSLSHEVGDMAQVGDALLIIDSADSPSKKAETETPAASPPTPPRLQRTESMESSMYPPGKGPTNDLSSSGSTLQGEVLRNKSKALATPAVRRLLKENNLDISMILGTGKDGRVLKSDVLSYIEKGGSSMGTSYVDASDDMFAASQASGEPSGTAHNAPLFERRSRGGEPDRVEPIRGIQRQMVKSMTKALTIPHFNLMEEFEMNELIELRAKLKSEAESRGIKLSYLPFLIKSASLSLTQHPVLNATVNDDCSEITYRSSHNISVAMDTPRGLLVPNVKDVQDKSIFEVAHELSNLQQLGAQNKLGEYELTNGTFSLSNIGTIGGTYASPVVMSPQVAIGAIGRIQRVPRFDSNDNVVAANIMNVSWAADHRVIDGATMARFSNLMKSYVENPTKMLMDMA